MLNFLGLLLDYLDFRRFQPHSVILDNFGWTTNLMKRLKRSSMMVPGHYILLRYFFDEPLMGEKRHEGGLVVLDGVD